MCCYQFLLLTLVKFKKNCTQNEKIMNKTTQKSIKKNFFFFFFEPVSTYNSHSEQS